MVIEWLLVTTPPLSVLKGGAGGVSILAAELTWGWWGLTPVGGDGL